jgi:hypothetical protein
MNEGKLDRASLDQIWQDSFICAHMAEMLAAIIAKGFTPPNTLARMN